MLRRTLNLGILAHVDAGKTTLTERLLFAAGVIDEVGSVDHGTTQTDSLALEQQRGITIKSAVVSFTIADVTVNLIDTPGHPDFIAEVERVLGVLDGAVLVVSAVEGVQAQTRILMRALQRLRVPTLIFVNKIDRAGADDERVLRAIAERLTPAAVAMTLPRGTGTPSAGVEPARAEARLVDALAEHDDELLAAYVEDEAGLSPERIRDALATQTRTALVHPVFFGSARTGAGVHELIAALPELLPAVVGEAEGPLSASVFKIERDRAGERVSYVRLFAGTIGVRDRVPYGDGHEDKVTALAAFDGGFAVQANSVSAGAIAILRGLREIRIGDAIGVPRRTRAEHHFAPPTLETVISAKSHDEGARLRVALGQLAEQDPLIDVRRDDERGELSVSLYGEVQKEVIEATLLSDFGLAVSFSGTTTICIERPAGSGEAVELLHADGNPFNAGLGLRVEPAPAGSGLELRLRIDSRTIPLYVYKTRDGFAEHLRAYVSGTLGEGLHGWTVTDCVVTVTRCDYSVADGPPSRRGPTSTAADFRKLTPIVLMQALDQAGTQVCEPIARVRVEVPEASLGSVLPALLRLGAPPEPPALHGGMAAIDTVIAAARVHELRRELTALTGGEGVLETEFAGYEPVTGEPPVRRRRSADPRNRPEYLMHLARRVAGVSS